MLRQNPHGAEPLPAHWMQVNVAFPLPSQVGQATDSLPEQAEHADVAESAGLDAGSWATIEPDQQTITIQARIVLMGGLQSYDRPLSMEQVRGHGAPAR